MQAHIRVAWQKACADVEQVYQGNLPLRKPNIPEADGAIPFKPCGVARSTPRKAGPLDQSTFGLSSAKSREAKADR